MFARVATFQGDPAAVEESIERVRAQVQNGPPEGLEGAKMMMLVNRETGAGFGVTLFDSEQAMKRGDEALNTMSGGGERRGVEFFEVPVHTL
jgi:hypothetical protein